MAGTIFVSTDESTSSIFLVASEINSDNVNYGPRIEMRGGPRDESNDRVVIGNLNSRLVGTSFEDLNDNAGSGLYANNVYLEGRFYLPQAGITNDEESENPVRIWAGSSPENRTEAPFQVLQDGTMYASKGVFSGTIEATDSTFSGWLKTVGILIDRDNDTLTPERDENVLYVAYNSDEHPLIPDTKDLILKISGDGLAIWEGGLKVFTDTVDTSTPYYYDSENHPNPLPYIEAIEDLSGTNFRLLTKAL